MSATLSPEHARDTIVYCPTDLRNRFWPSSLAQQWYEQYPGLFDDKDLGFSRTQPDKHFYEWFVSIHLFQSRGARSLMEQYAYPSSPVKHARYKEVLTEEQFHTLADIEAETHAQLPDLFVIAADGVTFHFAEVKGGRDALRSVQSACNAAIWERLGIPVENIRVVPKT